MSFLPGVLHFGLHFGAAFCTLGAVLRLLVSGVVGALGASSTHPLKSRALAAILRTLAPSVPSAQAGPCAAAREGVSLAGFYITHACATEAR